jgi:hypothetical protein
MFNTWAVVNHLYNLLDEQCFEICLLIKSFRLCTLNCDALVQSACVLLLGCLSGYNNNNN